MKDKQPRGWRKVVALVACCLECFLFAGCIFGWPSMAYMLQQDGIFTQNCANLSVLLGPGNLTVNGTYEVAGNHTWAQDTGCDEQRSSIALAFTFATILLGIMAFPNGVIFDKYGLRVTRCLATAIAVSGHLMLAFAAPNDMSYLIYPGSICVGISCAVYIMTSFNVCLLAGAHSSTVAALYSGAVNSGASVFLIVKLAYDSGLSRRFGLFCLVGLYSYSVLITFLLLPRGKVYPRTHKDAEEKDDLGEPAADTIVVHNDQQNGVKVVSPPSHDEKSQMLSEHQSQTHSQSKQSKDLREILASPYYLLQLYWFAVLHLRVTFYCSGFNAWVDLLTHNDEEVSHLTNTYGYIQMGSIALAPFAGIIIDVCRRRILSKGVKDEGTVKKMMATAVVPCFIVSILCGSVVCICVLTGAATAGTVFIEVSRSFVYTTMGTYLSLTFPAHRFGILFGLTYATAGVGTSLQYAMLQWSLAWQSFVYPNIILIVAILCALSLPIRICIGYLRNRTSNLNSSL